MSTYPTHQVVYQCDSHFASCMQQHKEKVHHALKNAMHCRVRVHTADNEVIEGTVVGMDGRNVYLNLDSSDMRGFYPGFPPPRPRPPFFPGYNPILPLALFNLLTISLLL
ncbi:hypothetical protein [Paenibacillus dakarensis]|uniref:hypothetical protein n=1 Tax=Paenibacillus dakarensis TaxID=1527293 RepID=UPI0006D5A93F|nr:hypothetical protein [Paenibacillus dakarensis]